MTPLFSPSSPGVQVMISRSAEFWTIWFYNGHSDSYLVQPILLDILRLSYFSL